MNIAQVIRNMMDYMSSSQNPGGVTAEQLGMYDTNTVDAKLATLLPTGTFSASKYGDNNWTPPNVLGSFEGGWRNENRPFIPLLQEPNGSFCFLENATNGTKNGTYLTFLEFAADGKTLELNATPRRYEPPILQTLIPTHRVANVYYSEGKDVVWGNLINESDRSTKYFVALTGGTMDASGHICTILDSVQFDYQTRAILVKDRVYFVQLNNVPYVKIWYINVSDIVAGNTVTPVELTTWTTTGINGTVRSNQGGQYAAVGVSSDISADSVFFSDTNVTANNGSGSRNWSATHPTANRVRFVLQISNLAYWTGNTGYGNSSTIVMDIDFDALTITVLPESRIKTKMQNSGSGAVQDSVSAAFSAKYMTPVMQTHDQYLVTDKGQVLMIHYSNEGLGYYRYATMGKGVETTNFDKLHPNNFNIGAVIDGNQLYRRFGSLMGGNTFIRAAFPNGEMFVQTTTSQQDAVGKPLSTLMYAKVNTAYNGFTYKTDSGDVPGYKPTTNRSRVTGVAGGAVQTMLCTGADRKITKVGNGPLCPDRPNLSVPLEVVFDGNNIVDAGKGVYTMAATALDVMKSKARADYGSNFTTLTGLVTYAELWIPPGSKRTYPPVVAVLMWSPTDLKAFWVSYQVTLTFGSGSLAAGGNITNAAAVKALTTNTTTNVIGLNFNDRTSGQVYEHCDSSGNLVYTAMYSATMLNIAQPGSSSALRLELAISAAESDYNTTYARYQRSYTWYFGYDSLFMVDTVGPVLVDFTKVKDVAGAGIYYKKMQKDTLAQYWARTVDSSDTGYYIWLAAQVAEGYNIYFTDETPCLINGFFFSIGASSIDLSDIVADPSNKTFYVWLRLVNGVVSYVITPNQGDSYDLYIGKIVTNATQIESINIVKTTVFNW